MNFIFNIAAITTILDQIGQKDGVLVLSSEQWKKSSLPIFGKSGENQKIFLHLNFILLPKILFCTKKISPEDAIKKVASSKPRGKKGEPF